MTAVVPAFRDGANVLRSNPVLLFAGLLLAVGSQLQHVGEAVESPPLEAGVSLAWLLSKENVAVIPKASSETHMRENLAARELNLSDDELARIDAVDREHRVIDPDSAPWNQ